MYGKKMMSIPCSSPRKGRGSIQVVYIMYLSYIVIFYYHILIHFPIHFSMLSIAVMTSHKIVVYRGIVYLLSTVLSTVVVIV